MKHLFYSKWNMSNRFSVLVLMLSMIGLSAMAQTHRSRATRVQHLLVKEQQPTRAELLKDSAWTKLDSLALLSRNSSAVTTNSVLDDPYFAMVMGNPALYPSVSKRLFVLAPDTVSATDFAAKTKGSYFYLHNLQGYTDQALATTCLQYPGYALNLSGVNHRVSDKKVEKREPDPMPMPIIQSQDEAPITVGNEGDWNIVTTKPNFWNFKTHFSLQFTQNYVSDNWYKGGESHNALLAETILEANFNNRQKITFDNKLEMKLGFQTTHNDDLHKYKTNSDLLRLTNKLGLRAVKHWYYTVMLQSWTQFYKGYKSNDKRVYSDFMSPFESLLSVGMDYQYRTKNNRFNVNATLSPVAVKLKYVGRPSLVTAFGLDEGKHAKWEFGSNITANYTWNIVKNVQWVGRIYYFTDYTSTQVEWENTFNLSINRYLSARVFLYPRFDDSRKRKDDQSNFEFNELLSLGLKVDF